MLAQSCRRAFIIVTLSGLIAGCPNNDTDDIQQPSLDPRINSITVDPVVQGDAPVVNVSVTIPGISNKRVRRVTAEFRSTLEPDRPFVAAPGEFSEGTNNVWTGSLPALNLGPYEVKVNVNLRTGGPNSDGSITPPIDEFIDGVQAFSVGADSEECFRFDVPDNLQGWTHGGFKLVSDSSDVTACSQNLFIFGGGLHAPVTPNCLPSEQFRFDLVSPDLSARPGWSQTQGVVISAGWNLAELQMQPLLMVAGGTPPAVFSVDEGGSPLFYPLSVQTGSNELFRVAMGFDAGSFDGHRIRFYGAPMTVGGIDGFVRVIFTCPIPERPG